MLLNTLRCTGQLLHRELPAPTSEVPRLRKPCVTCTCVQHVWCVCVRIPADTQVHTHMMEIKSHARCPILLFLHKANPWPCPVDINRAPHSVFGVATAAARGRYVPGTGTAAFLVLAHPVLATALGRGRSHFTAERPEAQRRSTFPRVTQLESGRTGLRTPADCMLRPPRSTASPVASTSMGPAPAFQLPL